MSIEEKIPSPQEIKGEVKKFTQEEITSLKNFQVKTDQLVNQLGRIYLSKIKLNEQEDLLKNEIQKIEKEEQELAKSLSDKYGRGSLDINTGTFTPVE
jgi:predicted nuclease with TOPRIM domain